MDIPPIRHSTRITVAPKLVFDTLTTPKGWDGWFTHGTSITPGLNGAIRLRWQQAQSNKSPIEDGGNNPYMDPRPKLRL